MAGKVKIQELSGDVRNTLTPYATAAGSANTYAVTLSPAPTAYTEGMSVAVKINVENTGASTVNVNGLGARVIKKPNGNDVAAGNLKVGSVYTLRYNGTNFTLQGSDAAGNAVSADVLSGKTFSNDAGDQTGTMPNRGTVNYTPGTTNQAVAQGYHSGSGVVSGSANLVAGNIKDGVNIFGVVGTLAGTEVGAGALLLAAADSERFSSATVYTLIKEIELVNVHGALRIAFDLMSGSPGHSVSARLYKNGSAVGTERTTDNGSSHTTYSEDISGFVRGDKVQLYVKRNSIAQVICRNFRLSADASIIKINTD